LIVKLPTRTRRQHVEHGGDVAGELLAVGGQGDLPVRSGVQERGAGGGFDAAYQESRRQPRRKAAS
jgi:hypothetical protein